MLLRPLLDQQVLFFAGKGGVGKTTCSAAFSMAASRLGRRTLLVSTDPAHSTSDIFEQPIGPAGREVMPGLSAVEVDAEAEAARYVADVKRDIERMFSPETGPLPTCVTIGLGGGGVVDPSEMLQSASCVMPSPLFCVIRRRYCEYEPGVAAV